ncbi:hypothetical protein EVG20_g5902 [Dentipellis fragilis]|uniref:F-box domain-containing protein n=1 Tax=Dentipellis fragilis TaxID=205917 RepID=A0A4Y9YS80_9AGAM|nr:hypothetical protein EVG20_g5902 [Dentipellis fragilis]
MPDETKASGTEVSYTLLARPKLFALDRAETSGDRKKAVEVADQQLEELRRVTSAFQARRNYLVPIGRLPSEMIAHIFSFAVLVDPVLLYTPPNSGKEVKRLVLGWIKVTHVCRRWRQIALSNPALWVHLPCLSREWCEEAMARARPLPFIVQADTGGSWSPRMTAALSTAFSALSNTRVLDLTAVPQLLMAIIGKPVSRAPELQVIRLSAATKQNQVLVFPQNVVGIGLPRLSTLELINCYFQWSSPIYRSELLVHLEIRLLEGNQLSEELPASHVFPMEQLLDILQTASALRTLILVNACPPVPQWSEAAPVSHVISVPRLSSLKMTSYSILASSYLLAHLRLPAEASVLLRSTSPRSPRFPQVLPWLMTPCVSREPDLRPITALGISLTTGASLHLVFMMYDIDMDPFSANVYTPRYEVAFTSSLHECQEQMTLLCTALPVHSVETLILTGSHFATVSWWHRTFENMKNVRTVLQDGPRSAGQFIPALITRASSAPDGPVLFPRLETLAYRSAGNLGNFATIEEFPADLRRRAKLGYPVKKLHILDSRVDRSVRDELAKVVPQVVWHRSRTR